MNFRRVWSYNFFQEIASFDTALHHYKLVSFDTEFPGFLRNTPRYAPDSQRFEDLKFNVNNTKMIQLGITLFDEAGEVGGIWEFNFSEFDIQKDAYMEASIQLLKKNGFDFDQMKKDGITMHMFVPRFLQILSKHKHHLKWITFHGLYDFAHMLKLFTNRPLPRTDKDFAEAVATYFGSVLDIKVVAKHCEGLMEGEIGLSKLGSILKIERIGESHNAGSDSLLTVGIYARMKKLYGFEEGDFEGLLYGMAARIERPPTKTILRRFCRPLILRSTVIHFSGRPCNHCLPVGYSVSVKFMHCVI